MKVTLFPAQMLDPTLLAIETAATGEDVTVMVMLLLVAVVPLLQDKLPVTTQVTMSLLFNVPELKVGLLVPTFDPLIIH